MAASDAPVIALMGRGGQAGVVLDAALAGGLPVTGLLDDGDEASHFSIPVLGPIEGWREHRGASFIVGMSNVRQRVEVGDAMREAGATVLTVVHPGAYVSPRAQLGAGVCVMHGVSVHPHAHIGDFAIVNANTSVDHDCVLGMGVSVGPGCTLPGGVTVEEFAALGAGVVARPGVTVGARAVVGAGAVLTKDVPAGETWAGNPARALERR